MWSAHTTDWIITRWYWSDLWKIVVNGYFANHIKIRMNNRKLHTSTYICHRFILFPFFLPTRHVCTIITTVALLVCLSILRIAYRFVSNINGWTCLQLSIANLKHIAFSSNYVFIDCFWYVRSQFDCYIYFHLFSFSMYFMSMEHSQTNLTHFFFIGNCIQRTQWSLWQMCTAVL